MCLRRMRALLLARSRPSVSTSVSGPGLCVCDACILACHLLLLAARDRCAMPSSSLRPHIVFVLVDDWGYDLWPRSGGDLGALLPHIERTFVNDGLTLGRHYAFSWCAPSRRSFLSGRLPHNVLQDDQGCRGIPLEMTIFPETLKRAGYSTHFIGKWHCGYATPEATPTGRGFDSAIGFFGKAHDHFEHCMYHGASTGACNRAPDDTTGGPPLLDFFVDDRYGEGGSHPAVKTRQYSTHLSS